MAIETADDAQHELQVAVAEYIEDMGDAADADQDAMMVDMWHSMSYMWDKDIAREVAMREFGYVPA